MLRFGLIACVATLGLAGPALAQTTGLALSGLSSTDTTAPVEVTADSLEVNQQGGTAKFSGDVLVIQGSMRLAAPFIEITYVRLPDGTLGSDVDQIAASGGVTMVTAEEAAEAQEAVYSPLRQQVVMTGSVLLTQGPNTLSGTRLTVNLATGEGTMEGRVRTILNPATDTGSAQ